MTQAIFDQQLQLVREGLDKRAAHNAVCAALVGVDYKKFTANEEFTDDGIREWIETEGARIEKKWGTKIADSLAVNRDLYTKIEVPRYSLSPDAPPDTLLVWPKAGQIDNLLKLAEPWGADESATTELVDGQTVVSFWWDSAQAVGRAACMRWVILTRPRLSRTKPETFLKTFSESVKEKSKGSARRVAKCCQGSHARQR